MIDFLKYPFQSESTLYSCLSVKGGRGGGAKVDLLPIDNNIEKKRGVKKWLVTLLLFT